MALYVVTGGAGFIGSNIVARLDARGDDVIVIDRLGTDDKWRNLAGCRLQDVVPPAEMIAALDAAGGNVAAVIHMGAISSTTETDADLILENNFRTSCRLWRWCADAQVPFVYASSAATYGDGAAGFEDLDDACHLARLQPLNAYGWSKHLFDRWVIDNFTRGRLCPPSWAGLKFFNVYGQNEHHKGSQRSTALQLIEQVNESGRVKLFESHHPDYPNGGQKRDFIWVGDCAEITLWMAERSKLSGLYNVGTGVARSFEDLALAVFRALGREPAIDYIAMPHVLHRKYQYFTRADMQKLRRLGCPITPISLEEGVRRYVDMCRAAGMATDRDGLEDR